MFSIVRFYMHACKNNIFLLEKKAFFEKIFYKMSDFSISYVYRM